LTLRSLRAAAHAVRREPAAKEPETV
jgi:hypothetical protein